MLKLIIMFLAFFIFVTVYVGITVDFKHAMYCILAFVSWVGLGFFIFDGKYN